MMFNKTIDGFYESRAGFIEPQLRDETLSRLEERFEKDPELCSFLGLDDVQTDHKDQNGSTE
jgi:hypothetical protein